MSYDNTNRGVLFRQTDKRHDKAPDYKGTLDVEGKEYELAGWIRESKKGNKFLSVTISEPWQGGKGKSDSDRSVDAQRPSGGGGSSVDDFDQDFPFIVAETRKGRP